MKMYAKKKVLAFYSLLFCSLGKGARVLILVILSDFHCNDYISGLLLRE